jgi:AraC-like DNA-binding protein
MWFTLTALQDTATVQMAGISLPRVVEIRQSSTDFMLRERIKSLNICTLFYQEKEKDFLFSGEAHPLLEILYLDQGSLHSVADGQDLLLQPGELVVYGPNQWHMQYTDAGEAPRFITLSFQAEGCDLQALYNRAITMPSKAVALLQQMLWEQEQTDDYSQDYLLALFRQLLIILLRQSEEYSQVQTMPNIINSENKIISCAQQYILANVKEKLSVPVVAKGINISPSYLTALFQKHLRISPGEYIRRIKLQQSKQMIREGELNFTEIAQALQYSTVHHFSRQFKEKFGITPTEYARTVR